MKVKEREWLTIGDVRDEAILTGKVVSTRHEKQRFYYHRYILVQEIRIQTDTGIQIAKKMIPFKQENNLQEFLEGESVRLIGSWDRNFFLFERFDRISKP